MADKPTGKKLLAAGYAMLLLAVIVLLSLPPASEYEISMYRAFPWYFWVFVIGGLFLSQMVIMLSATDESDSNWRLGLILALLFDAILVFLPFIRGYPYFERADVLTHLGHIKMIQETGIISGENIYPNIHQFVLTLSYATGLEPMRVITAVSGVIGLFSIVATYVLLATIYDRQRALFTLPFAILISGTAYVNPSPYVQSVLMFPFVLYLFSREQYTHSFPIRLALAIAIVSVVIYHPLTAMFMLFVFLLFAVVKWVSNTPIWEERTEVGLETTGSGNVSKIMLATGIAWYYNFAGIIIRFHKIIITTLNPSQGESTIDSYGSTIARTSPALVDLARVALASYGAPALVMALGSIYSLKLLVDRLRGRLRASIFESTFVAGLGFFAVLSLAFLTMDLIVGFGRPMMFAQYFGIFLAGSLVLAFYERFDRSNTVLQVTAVVLVALVVVSVFGIYHSPVDAQVNQHVTDKELDGAAWIIDHHEQTTAVHEYGITLYRFEDAFYGKSAEQMPTRDSMPPDHFGYNNNSTAGITYQQDHYLVITSLGRMYYEEMYPQYREFWRFTDEDFARLETDQTVSKVYTNGEFDTYVINATDGGSQSAQSLTAR